MDTLKLTAIEEMRELFARNSHLTTEQFSLELISFIKRLYISSSIIFHCKGGLSHSTLCEFYQFLETWETEIKNLAFVAKAKSIASEFLACVYKTN
jgi:hypothetical protein